MLRDFNQGIIGLNNLVLVDENGSNLVLGHVAVGALLANLPNENIDGVEKAKRFALAMRIHGKEEAVEVTAEEVAKIKELVGKVYTTVVVGRAYDLLEQKLEEVKTSA